MDRKYEILYLYELFMIMYLFYLKWTNINLIIFKMSLIFTKKMQLSCTDANSCKKEYQVPQKRNYFE